MNTNTRTTRSTVLAAIIVVAAVAVGVAGFAGTAVAEESTDPDLLGEGTNEDPYKISSAEDLEEVREDLDAHYVLVDDIDDVGDIEPIGGFSDGVFGGPDPYPPLSGTFDGNGHTIDGISNTRGLFAASIGTIKNVSLTNVDVKSDRTGASENAGGLVGFNVGEISNAHVEGEVEGEYYTGLLAGYNNGNISRSSASGTVTGNDAYVGGLVGWHSSPGMINESFSTATVENTGDGDDEVAAPVAGGLVGMIGHDPDDGGGMGDAVVTDSYATGAVFDSAASADPFISEKGVGGLVGTAMSGEISNSYATGSVSGTNSSGVVGVLGEDTFENKVRLKDAYWDQEESGVDDAYTEEVFAEDESEVETAGDISGLSSDEMQGTSAQTSMESLDFEDSWELIEDGPPELAHVEATTDPAAFLVEINETATDDSVEQGDEVTLVANVTNDGDETGSQSIELEFGEETVDTVDVDNLNGGSDQDVTLTHTVAEDADTGDITAEVSSQDDTDSYDVTVETATDPATFLVEINETATDDSVQQGDEVTVVANVTNDGDETGSQSIELEFGEETVDTVDVNDLEGGSNQDVTLTHTVAEDADTDNITADVSSQDDTDSYDVTVETAAEPSLTVGLVGDTDRFGSIDAVEVEWSVEDAVAVDGLEYTLEADGEAAVEGVKIDAFDPDEGEQTETLGLDDSDAIDTEAVDDGEYTLRIENNDSDLKDAVQFELEEADTGSSSSSSSSSDDDDDETDETDEPPIESVRAALDETEPDTETTTQIEDVAADQPGVTTSPDDTESVHSVTFSDDAASGNVEITEWQAPPATVDDSVRNAAADEIESETDAGEPPETDVPTVVEIAPEREELRDQPARVQLTVDPARLSSPENGVITHEQGDSWEILETRVAEVEDRAVTLEAETGSFSLFAVADIEGVAGERDREASTAVSDVTLETEHVTEDDPVAVAVTVEHSGEIATNESVELLADGTTVATRSVAVAPGERVETTLSFEPEAGEYELAVDGTPAGTVTVTSVERLSTELVWPELPIFAVVVLVMLGGWRRYRSGTDTDPLAG